jgi:purine-binding chemotaxis protein CheW
MEKGKAVWRKQTSKRRVRGRYSQGSGNHQDVGNNPYSELSRIEGVVHLRGKVAPVINLRKKLDMSDQERNKNTCVIVVDLNGKTIGFVVDAVREVLRRSKSIAEPPPDIVTGVDAEYRTASGTLNDRLLTLLDMEKFRAN